MAHYVYVLKSKSDESFYVGYSADPLQRLEKHNSPHKGYTGRKQPWEIVHIEEYPTKGDAIRREVFLEKQKSSRQTIQGTFQRWAKKHR